MILALPLGASAATAQPLPCTSVSPEAREYVRSRGACRDIKAAPRPKRATKSRPGASVSAAPAPQVPSGDSVSPTPAPENQLLPYVIGRSVADAASTLAGFKVERIETASAAPAGEVLAQEPAAAALVRTGSTVTLRVSDGSLAVAARAKPVKVRVAAAVTRPATAQAISPAPTSTPEEAPPPEPNSSVLAESTEAATAPAPATSPAPTSTPLEAPPPEPVSPVAAETVEAATPPAPATSLALATTPVVSPPQVRIDVPGVRDEFPAPFPVVAALIFVAGISLGLLSGALLMRQRLLRGRQVERDSAPPPTLNLRLQPVDQPLVVQQPIARQLADASAVEQKLVDQPAVDQKPADEPPVEPRRVDPPVDSQLTFEQQLVEQQLEEQQLTVQPAVDQEPIEQQLAEVQPVEQPSIEQPLVEQQLVEQQLADQPPVESPGRDLPATGESPEIQFAAWLVPSATTIVLVPRRATDGIRTSIRSATTHQQASLFAPIEVGGNAIERAFYEQGKDDSNVARVFEQLCGDAAELAADELNRALDVDILDLLAQGWVQMPELHGAVQLSAVTRGPPVLVKIDVTHSITSTSLLVLETRMAGSSLPPLELALEIVADLHYATLAVDEGRIDLVTLGETAVFARLMYGDVPVHEHATAISATPRQPSAPRAQATERPSSIDFPI